MNETVRLAGHLRHHCHARFPARLRLQPGGGDSEVTLERTLPFSKLAGGRFPAPAGIDARPDKHFAATM